MKKLLLSFAALGFAFSTHAQCTPDETLIPDAFGVYPDTTQNFVNGVVGEPYVQVLHFKAPTDAGEINPQFAGATINTFTVTGVEGIPPGLSYTCNISNCQYDGGSTGCASITGTPTESGEFDITINITANINLGPLGNQDIPQAFEGYRIVVTEDGEVSIVKNEVATLSMYPNPVNEALTIGNLNDFNQAIAVNLYNLSGKLVSSSNVQGLETIIVNTSALNAGVYFVELQHLNGVERQKFIKE